MGNLAEFGINIIGLEDKQYEFSYSINERFFGNFENSDLKRGDLTCKAILSKMSSFIRVTFHIKGWIELVCDRSLDPFQYPIQTEGQVIFKYGEEEIDLDDEESIISRNRKEINLAQSIYELISVAVPMKKLHPRYGTQEEGRDELIYSTQSGEPDIEKKQGEIDPRWEALKKLKNNSEE